MSNQGRNARVMILRVIENGPLKICVVVSGFFDQLIILASSRTEWSSIAVISCGACHRYDSISAELPDILYDLSLPASLEKGYCSAMCRVIQWSGHSPKSGIEVL